jgi:hypothetical protein
MEKTLTNSVEILEALNSVDSNDWEVEDQVYLNDLDTNAVKYTHVDGYFYSDNTNNYWTADPYDFDTDEETEAITMNNTVWLSQRKH